MHVCVCIAVTLTLLVSLAIPHTCGVLTVAEVFCFGVAMADRGNAAKIDGITDLKFPLLWCIFPQHALPKTSQMRVTGLST